MMICFHNKNIECERIGNYYGLIESLCDNCQYDPNISEQQYKYNNTILLENIYNVLLDIKDGIEQVLHKAKT